MERPCGNGVKCQSTVKPYNTLRQRYSIARLDGSELKSEKFESRPLTVTR
jgi:hypothetical protein